jgi:hypothetical protein
MQLVRIVTAVLQGTSVRGVFQIVTCCVDPERIQGGFASFKNNMAEKWRIANQRGTDRARSRALTYVNILCH